MKYGKKVCEKLKEIRVEVARANDIPYEPAECHHEGDCSGSCPQCEAEVRYLERQLDLKRVVGKAAFFGMAVGVAMAVESCGMRTVGEADITGMLEDVDTAKVDSAQKCPANTIDMPMDGK